eukprot:2490410-Pyramimonas_sp.AAC.1
MQPRHSTSTIWRRTPRGTQERRGTPPRARGPSSMRRRGGAAGPIAAPPDTRRPARYPRASSSYGQT